MKKFSFWQVTIAIIIIALISAIPATAEQIRLRAMTWDSEQGLIPIKAIFAQVEKDYPNIKIDVLSVPEAYNDKLLTSFAGGTPPDLFMISNDWQQFAVVKTGGVEALNNYILGKKGGPKVNIEDIFGVIRKGLYIGGNIYGLPKDTTNSGVYYNKELFDKCGLSYPKADWTWKDFRELAIKLTKDWNGDGKIDQWGTFVDTGMQWGIIPNVILAEGGKFFSPDFTKAKGYMNSPATVKAVQFATDLYLKDKAACSPELATTLGGTNEMFLTNKLGLLVSGSWLMLSLRGSKIQWNTALIPKGAVGRRSGCTVCTWAMSASTKYKDEAWIAVSYAGGPIGNRMQGQMKWGLPTYKSVAKELGYLDPKVPESVFLLPILNGEAPPWPVANIGNPSEAMEIWQNAMTSILLGKATVKDALDKAAEAIDKVLIPKKL
jgi:multiple sugar transport system substrate-binding protein